MYKPSAQFAAKISRPHLLSYLSLEEDLDIVRAVASNPYTPRRTLLALLRKDNAMSIRQAVTKNPALPVDMATDLMTGDYLVSLLKTLASNPSLPVALMDTLAMKAEWDYGIAMGLACNPKAPSHILLPLTEHERTPIREAALRNILARVGEDRVKDLLDNNNN